MILKEGRGGAAAGYKPPAGSAPVPVLSTLTPLNLELMIWMSQAPTITPHLKTWELNVHMLNVTYFMSTLL